jgi:alpha-tubulin suppressor-like RCC1 family protein
MAGSSYFKIIRTEVVASITGPTGSTGNRGNTGAVGYGPTGPTGVGIKGISLQGKNIFTEFTDGTTFITTNQISGPQGPSIITINVVTGGSGASIVSSKPSSNSIIFRSMKGSTSTSGRSRIQLADSGVTLTVTYTVNTDGVTLIGDISADALGGILGTTGTGLSLTNIRDSRYDETTGAAAFGLKNVVEKARGLGFTGATQAEFGIPCNYGATGIIDLVEPCTIAYIHPYCKSNNSVDYGTRNKTYYMDFNNSVGKIIIGDPINPSTSSAFTLVVKNAANSPVGIEKRFQSTSGNLYWPFGKEPCFTGQDVYHFYNLFGSWFGSVVSTNDSVFDCYSAGTPPGDDGEADWGACCEIDPCPPHKRVSSLVASHYGSAYVDSSTRKIRYWSVFPSVLNIALLNKIPSTHKSYKIGLGTQHICSIDNQTYGITCWGFAGLPQIQSPSNAGYTAISSSPGHNLAINNSGGVTAWGNNSFGQCNVPSGLTNVKQVAAGLYHSMALKADGTVSCWGAGTGGVGGIFYDKGQCNIPAGITFSYIAAFDLGGIGIASRGSTVYAWGATLIANNVPTGLTAVKVAGSMDENAGTISYETSGSGFAVAIKSNGTLVGWGNTLSVQNILPSFSYTSSTDVALGKHHGNIISNNTLFAWGNGLTLPCGPCGITCVYRSPVDCAGPNKYFRGVGVACSSQPCEVTGPCCMTIGEAITTSQCFPGITLENCLCGLFNGALENATFVSHLSTNSCSSCGTSNPNLGGCCIPDSGCVDMTSEGCLAAGGIYNAGQLCTELSPNHCDFGRCCGIVVSDLDSSTCTQTIQSMCVSSGSFQTDWLEGANCTESPCYLRGSCCRSSSQCVDNTVSLPSHLSSFALLVTDPNYCPGVSFNNNSTCSSTNCNTSSGLGLCLVADCILELVTQFDNDTLPECMVRGPNTRFYPNVSSTTTGRCCKRYHSTQEEIQCRDSFNAFSCFDGPAMCSNNDPKDPSQPLYDFSFNPNTLCSAGCTYPDDGVSSTQGGGVASSDSKDKLLNNFNYVGDYYPVSSDLYGKDFKKCCPISFDNLNSGNEVSGKTYTSQIDWYGYGVKDINNSDAKASNIKFKIHVYHKDLYYEDVRGNVIKTVIWGQTGNNCAWGPNIEKDENGMYYINDLRYLDKVYDYYKDEGYWQVTNVNYSAETLLDKTFNKQPNLQFVSSVAGLITTEDSKFSNNGGWRRNWGIYNTMRLIGADNAYYALNNPIPGTTYSLPNDWTAARLVDKLNSESSFNSLTSSWFIPSMDEMAFVCNNLGTITKNMVEPMIGDYWTSTGSFDEKTNEGKKAKLKSITQNGSKAWAFSIAEKQVFIEEDPNPYEVKVRKENRESLLKVRPIRIELENVSDIPLEGTEEYKLWKLQPIKWVREK